MCMLKIMYINLVIAGYSFGFLMAEVFSYIYIYIFFSLFNNENACHVYIWWTNLFSNFWILWKKLSNEAQEYTKKRFPNRQKRNRKTYVWIERHICDHRGVEPLTVNWGRPRLVCHQQTKEQISDALEEHYEESTHGLSFKMGVLKDVVHRFIKQEPLHQYQRFMCIKTFTPIAYNILQNLIKENILNIFISK